MLHDSVVHSEIPDCFIYDLKTVVCNWPQDEIVKTPQMVNGNQVLFLMPRWQSEAWGGGASWH